MLYLDHIWIRVRLFAIHFDRRLYFGRFSHISPQIRTKSIEYVLLRRSMLFEPVIEKVKCFQFNNNKTGNISSTLEISKNYFLQ